MGLLWDYDYLYDRTNLVFDEDVRERIRVRLVQIKNFIGKKGYLQPILDRGNWQFFTVGKKILIVFPYKRVPIKGGRKIYAHFMQGALVCEVHLAKRKCVMECIFPY